MTSKGSTAGTDAVQFTIKLLLHKLNREPFADFLVGVARTHNQISVRNQESSHSGSAFREKNSMKKLLLACTISLAAFSVTAGTSFADAPKNSKYCMDNTFDPLCMTPEMMEMRTKMMAMSKDKVMENRTNYCKDNANSSDPICDPKMMNDTTGY
jgi:hypothetical protein